MTVIPFAFYGRVSTEDNQDPAASRAWQLRRATELIAPHGGEIVAQYFDVGVSRSLPWRRRPAASELLDVLRDPARSWGAIVIGEPHRAFYANQFSLTFPLLCHFGSELWVPEVGGRVDPESEAHDLMMAMFGGLSKAERSRIRMRVRAAMAAMAADGGRFMGGRPPFGYLLIDAGPHPNPSKAADGKRLHHLEIDPVSAVVVERIFSRYASGAGLRSIAEELTADGVLSPAAYDRARNLHRDPTGWAHTAVRAILANPIYAGRAVWGKQHRFERLADPNDVAAGNVSKMTWRSPEHWIEAREPSHLPIVASELAALVAERLASGEKGQPRPRKSAQSYLLRGILYCGLCHRRMQGSARSGGRILYRCEYGRTRALPGDCAHPPTLYVREEAITGPLDRWLASLATAEVLAGSPDPAPIDVDPDRARISEIDQKIARLVTALEDGGDSAVLNPRIATLSAERRRLDRTLVRPKAGRPPTTVEIAEMLEALQGLVSALESTDPAQRTRIHQELGVSLTYDPNEKVVHASTDLACVVSGRVGGGTRYNSTRALAASEGVGLSRVGEGTRDNPFYEVGTTDLWLRAA